MYLFIKKKNRKERNRFVIFLDLMMAHLLHQKVLLKLNNVTGLSPNSAIHNNVTDQVAVPLRNQKNIFQKMNQILKVMNGESEQKTMIPMKKRSQLKRKSQILD